jgi:hypothetical protein
VDDDAASQSVAQRLGSSAEKENTMKDAIYSWQTTYWSAVLETNPKQLCIRINEARRAIDDRLREPIQINSHELRAIEDARTALAELEAELVERNGILLL